MILPNPFKPWFIHRPSQWVRRAMRAARPPSEPNQVVGLPWGCPIEIDIRETVGRSIWTTGIYDLAVVEVLMRLADPRKLSLDVGANIGSMTGALATRSAEVWAFEPHPDMNRRLAGNVARFAVLPGFAPCRIFDLAASDTDGTSVLVCPDGFSENNGIARLAESGFPNGLSVRTARLDTLLADREVGVMKLDVEGHELAVLRGTATALAAGRVDHIAFEDHAGSGSPVAEFLVECGYAILGIGWQMNGPLLTAGGRVAHRHYEAPSFLATRDPAKAIERCGRRGWESLQRRSPRPLAGAIGGPIGC